MNLPVVGRWVWLGCLALFVGSPVIAQRRAPVPTFAPEAVRGVFFDSVDAGLGGKRPTIESLRDLVESRRTDRELPRQETADDLSGVISGSTLESEVKRVKLRYDTHVKSPGKFKGGGFQDAQVDLSILAMLMAVISDYDGEVRWKDDAAAARDVLAKSAVGVRAGSTTAFKEAQARQRDLQSLLSGSGISSRRDPKPNDWSAIAQRTPLMRYFEELIERLESDSYDAAAIAENVDATRRDAELLALLGRVIANDGMEGAEDDEYCVYSADMTARARKIVAGIVRDDFAAAGAAVNSLRESCDNCHADYR